MNRIFINVSISAAKILNIPANSCQINPSLFSWQWGRFTDNSRQFLTRGNHTGLHSLGSAKIILEHKNIYFKSNVNIDTLSGCTGNMVALCSQGTRIASELQQTPLSGGTVWWLQDIGGIFFVIRSLMRIPKKKPISMKLRVLKFPLNQIMSRPASSALKYWQRAIFLKKKSFPL